MKLRLRKKDYIFLTIAAIATAAGLSVKFASSSDSNGPVCSTPGQDRVIVMANDTFTPSTVTANQCDRIVLLNKDSQEYRPALGIHSEHVAYPGFFESTIPAGSGISFIAVKPGEYKIHDHLRDVAHADLVIAPKK